SLAVSRGRCPVGGGISRALARGQTHYLSLTENRWPRTWRLRLCAGRICGNARANARGRRAAVWRRHHDHLRASRGRVFTGLIDDVGRIASVAPTDAGREFRIECRYSDLTAGESIAVNGACLTVREFGTEWFTAAAVTTTLDRTTMGSWIAGARVNLERALRVGDRLGGHFVQGHVDGVASVETVEQQGDAS